MTYNCRYYIIFIKLIILNGRRLPPGERKKMINIALLGFGTVGSGVADVIDENRDRITARAGDEINIKYVLDLRDFPGHRYESRIVKDFGIILNDPEISVVVEMLGGVHPAADFTRAALEAGKNVVTSNKAVVADCGDELLALARKRNVRYLFEASVGGGIPVLRPLSEDLSENRIEKISGILNGTTNFILTEMSEKGAGFEETLREAQRLGYAEADPTADVGGFDAARKIVILAALAWGKLFPLDAVSIDGIERITQKDISDAATRGCRIKLIAEAELNKDGRIALSVAPRLLPLGSMLASVNGVFNAVMVRGSVTGDTVFYGRGAGKFPTAGAVVSDVIDACTRPAFRLPAHEWKRADAADAAPAAGKYLTLCE